MIAIVMAKKGRKRRHHNNKGLRQIQRDKPAKEVKEIARRLGVPYKEGRNG